MHTDIYHKHVSEWSVVHDSAQPWLLSAGGKGCHDPRHTFYLVHCFVHSSTWDECVSDSKLSCLRQLSVSWDPKLAWRREIRVSARCSWPAIQLGSMKVSDHDPFSSRCPAPLPGRAFILLTFTLCVCTSWCQSLDISQAGYICQQWTLDSWKCASTKKIIEAADILWFNKISTCI